MTVVACLRPAQPNVGNAVIFHATVQQLRGAFGADVAVLDLPALSSDGRGGLTAAQVYDINRLADAVVVGGGNLFENGQLTIDPVALAALQPPLMVMGVSHGRIHGRDGRLVERTDSLPANLIRELIDKAEVALVRDHATRVALEEIGTGPVEVAGCPTLGLRPPEATTRREDRILVSVRHPARMSIPVEAQWRVAENLRSLIRGLKRRFGETVFLVCHDYLDLELARGLGEAPLLLFSGTQDYLDALFHCRLSVTYRLHAFLPALAFGTPSIPIVYDGRARELAVAAGMGDWNLELMSEPDLTQAVMNRIDNLGSYERLRSATAPIRDGLLARMKAGVDRFAAAVSADDHRQVHVR